jgi:hypothetical protein
MSIYSMDTCCLIYAMRQAYPINNFPAFWKNLHLAITNGTIHIIESVKDEISHFDNEVLTWVETLEEDIFTKVNNPIISHVATIVEKCPKLINAAENKDEADPYVIALAMLNKGTVVTQENMSNTVKPNQKKIKIPNACKELNIKCISLTDMIIELNWVFS